MSSNTNRIAIDARIINSTTGTYIKELLNNLQEIDDKNEYIILVPSNDIDYWKPKKDNFKLKVCDYKNYSIEEQFGFKSFLDSIKPDLVHFCMPQQPILYHGKTVTTFHDLTLLKLKKCNSNENYLAFDKNYLTFKIKQFLAKKIFKKIAKKTDAIIAPTEYTKKDLLNYFSIDPKKIFVTYEAANVDANNSQKKDIGFDDYILNVGRHSDYKNNIRLARVHQKLLKKHPNLGLVFANSFDQSTINNKRLFEKMGYKNIIFTGKINTHERDYLYQHAKVYATLSFFEGFGLTGVEAISLGCPVLSSNATCLPEVYGKGAIYCDPNDDQDIYNKLDELLTNEKMRTDLINAGREQAKKFSWKKMAKETLEVYNFILKDK